MSLRLTDGSYSVLLTPEVGGALSGAWYNIHGDQWPILRPARDILTDVTDSACFPLAPFCNRLRDGHLRFRGREVQLPPNMPRQRHPLHGQAWQEPWTLESHTSNTATIRFRHSPGHWPWLYEVHQTVEVSETGILIAITLTNLDSAPMPAGIGLHPYFPSTEFTRLRTQVSSVQLTDGDTLVTGDTAPAELDYDLSDRRISGSGLDHGFADWSGELEILYPDYGVRMTASPNARWLQVYTPVDAAYFCAEPVTHANDAFAAPETSWPDLGVKVLETGDTVHMVTRLQGFQR